MRYVGRTKVGKVKTNPTTELAIIRLPVDMKEKAGKYAHIWKADEDTIVIRFSDAKEVEELPSVYLDVHQAMGNDVEERLRRLETVVEDLKNAVFCKKQDDNISQNIKKCAGRDLNPGQGRGRPLC